MSAYQHLIDSIRAVCNAVDQTASPELTEWASRYAELCREANERLRRCADLLRYGLRSEALHLADQAPAVLDLVSVLDFPELGTWESLCAAYNLARPARLSMEFARQVNEAYADHATIAPVLRVYRVACMAAAPLSDRMAIAREMIAMDPGIQTWQNDLAMLETLRLKEVRSELQQAIKQADLTTLQAILRELETTSWQAPLPADLRSQAAGSVRQLQQRDGVTKLRALLPALNEAYSAMAVDEASSIAGQWAQIIAEHQIAVPADLGEAVSPIHAWLAEAHQKRANQQEFDWGCARLEELLRDNATPTPTLEGQMRTLQSAALPLPESLERSYHTVIGSRQRTIVRQKRRNIAIACLTAAVVVGGAGLASVHIYHTRQSAKHAERIVSLTDQGKLAEAARALEDATTANYGKSANIVDAAARLHTATDTETRRIEKFSVEVARLALAIKEKQKDISFTAIEMLGKATEEKLKILKLKEDDAVNLREAAQARLTLAQERLGQLTALIKAAEQASGASDMETLRSQTRAGGELLSLLQNTRETPAELAEGVKAIAGRMNALNDRLKREDKHLGVVSKLKSALHSADALAAAIAATGENGPAMETEFMRLHAERLKSSWIAVERWAVLSGQLSQTMESGSLTTLQKAREDLAAYAKEFPESPVARRVTMATAYVNDAIQWIDPGSDRRKALATLLASRPMAGWLQVRTKAGTFFVSKPADISPSLVNGKLSSIRMNYIVGETTEQDRPATREYLVSAKDLLDPEKAEGEQTDQNALSQQAVAELDKTDAMSWESLPSRLAKVIFSHSTVNPTLKAILLDSVLDMQHSPEQSASIRIRQSAESLQSLRAGEAAWMNPLDEKAKATAKRCETWLNDQKELPQLLLDHAELRKKGIESWLLTVETTGVVVNREARMVFNSDKLPPLGTVYAVLHVTTSSRRDQAALVPVRSIKDGQIVNNFSTPTLPEGAMLFVTAKTLPQRSLRISTP